MAFLRMPVALLAALSPAAAKASGDSWRDSCAEEAAALAQGARAGAAMMPAADPQAFERLLRPWVAPDAAELKNSATSVEGLRADALELAPDFMRVAEGAASAVPGSRFMYWQDIAQSPASLERRVQVLGAHHELSGRASEAAVQHVGDAIVGGIAVPAAKDVVTVLSNLDLALGNASAGGAVFALGVSPGPAATVHLRLGGGAKTVMSTLEVAVGNFQGIASARCLSDARVPAVPSTAAATAASGAAPAKAPTVALRGATLVGSRLEAISPTSFHLKDGLWYRASLASTGGLDVLHRNGSWVSAGVSNMTTSDAAAALTGAMSSTQGPMELSACYSVGGFCFMMAECCSGRCVGTNRCGPRVR